MWSVMMYISVLIQLLWLKQTISCVVFTFHHGKNREYPQKCELFTSGSGELDEFIRQWNFWLYSVQRLMQEVTILLYNDNFNIYIIQYELKDPLGKKQSSEYPSKYKNIIDLPVHSTQF